MEGPENLSYQESKQEEEKIINENKEFKAEEAINDLNKTIKDKGGNMDLGVATWANKWIANSNTDCARFVAKNLDMLNKKGTSKECIFNIIDHVFWQGDESRVNIFCKQTFNCCSSEDKEDFANAIVERGFNNISISDPELSALVKDKSLKKENDLNRLLDQIPNEYKKIGIKEMNSNYKELIQDWFKQGNNKEIYDKVRSCMVDYDGFSMDESFLATRWIADNGLADEFVTKHKSGDVKGAIENCLQKFIDAYKSATEEDN